ncbi:DUF5689 domain-containing protein [uncultured Alistipes sp.]|uniref:DUF5689 domain-containing protein n=1 Tax=uncultured Alistipes sp. TaxID=538949 RepID=UPI002637DD38|nr:DUF5689 domain-containing protein [uncultured Alistipes sp.]
MKRTCCNDRTTARARTALLRAGMTCLLLLFGAGYDRATAPRYGGPSDDETVSITRLKALADRSGATAVRQEINIRGRITGNDCFGEFYKTLVLEDAYGGISLAVDATDLFYDYPFGYVLTVRCNGLTLCEYGGKLVLGTTPTDDGPGRIAAADLSRYLTVSPPDGSRPEPQLRTIPEIGTADIDRYVRLDGVCFPDGGTWCAVDPETGRHTTTEHRIVDTDGNTFTVRAASTCTYADEPVPSGTGSLCGIVDCFNGKFTLRVTDCGVLFVSAAAPPRAYP